jgi:murein L,D-transpeptidase YafK
VNLLSKIKAIKLGPIRFSNYINKGVARNIIYLTGAILLFFFGVIVYGIILKMREVPLSEAMIEKGFTELSYPNLVIDRKNYTLSLYEDSVLIKSYRASFGKSVSSPKTKASDRSTPVGEYKICRIDTSSVFHIFMQINYPNLEDAMNALRKGWISQKEFNDIKFQYYYEGCTKYNAILGGDIGIHGIGKYNYVFKNLPFVYNWTNGSIALSNEDIDELHSIVKEGTKVVIK